MTDPTKEHQNFFTSLEPLTSFFDITDPSKFTTTPDDWYLGITDIVNSSGADTTEGYKWVNVLGAAPIVALMNETGRTPLPYTFGGDGCAFLVPPELKDTAARVLCACRNRGRSAFGLELRIALIPVKELHNDGHMCNVARLKTQEQFDQSVFNGGGLSKAESILKDADDFRFDLPENSRADADFSGLECRWQEVQQQDQKVYTYLIRSKDSMDQKQTYKRILKEMRDIFGFDDKTNPLSENELEMSLDSSVISGEIRFRTDGRSLWQRFMYNLEIRFRILAGIILMKFGVQTSKTDWSLYRKDMVLNNDHRKFDDMLRMVISATEEQGDRFRDILEKFHNEGHIVFGEHASDGALITCMVFDWQRRHQHFVDGSGGGYAKAASDLKKRNNQNRNVQNATGVDKPNNPHTL